jgi:hypothetical protein
MNKPFPIPERRSVTLEELTQAARIKAAERRASNRTVEVDGKVMRLRRGKLVEIPPEWVGKVTHKQTIRKRVSKQD